MKTNFKLLGLFKILGLASLLVLILTACSPAAIQRVVALPDPLRVAIETVAVFVVGWVFAQIGIRLPWFAKMFGEYADEVAFALSGAVLATIQSWLDLIPVQWETPVNLFLAFLVAVFAALQVFRLLGKAGARTFRA